MFKRSTFSDRMRQFALIIIGTILVRFSWEIAPTVIQ